LTLVTLFFFDLILTQKYISHRKFLSIQNPLTRTTASMFYLGVHSQGFMRFFLVVYVPEFF